MNIRKKIIVYFSVTTIILMGVALMIIYTSFSTYREQEFLQRMKDKVSFSLRFLGEIEKVNGRLLNNLDMLTINDLTEEKMLLFNGNKRLIYASLDDTKIDGAVDILSRLGPQSPWIQTKEDKFEVIGTYFQQNNKGFYGIYKAYDNFGFTQLNYLKWILIVVFLSISLVILAITFYLSRQISAPINKMAVEISHLEMNTGENRITVPKSKDEIHFLANRFNELMQRLEQAFQFQKHVVHHISHELKTPVGALVSNFERMEREQDAVKLKTMLSAQKEQTLTLSDIINTLLEISRLETGTIPKMEPIRIDELIFEVISRLEPLWPEFRFKVDIDGLVEDEQTLMVKGNSRLLDIVFGNLLANCIHYGRSREAFIRLKPGRNKIFVEIQNDGPVILPEEQELLFGYFFRGKNSEGRRSGFGLGLVMVKKILALHGGDIQYEVPGKETNLFKIQFARNNERNHFRGK